MSTEYIAYIKDQEYGPVSFSDLRDMWARGEVTNETQVRFSDGTTCASWKDARNLHERKQAETARTVMRVSPPATGYVVKDYPAGMPGARDKLRVGTAYPILRVCLIVLLVLSGICCALSLCFISEPESRPLAIEGIIASTSSAFWALILGVLLDIADVALRKIG